jgi:hypothetical protein
MESVCTLRETVEKLWTHRYADDRIALLVAARTVFDEYLVELTED